MKKVSKYIERILNVREKEVKSSIEISQPVIGNDLFEISK